MTPKTTTPLQTILVYPGLKFSVTEGANFGDPLSFAEDLLLDDIYCLEPGAATARLSLATQDGADHFVLTPDTELGTPGNDLHLDCAITLMAPDGQAFDALIFVEVENGEAASIFLHPLAAMKEKVDYRLVGLTQDNVIRKMAEVACVSFTRGTHITMASGRQVKIEDIKEGDRVLTRNDGPQAVRWLGQNTVRAMGEFSPVLIEKGTLNNENDLIVSPDHRLFIYQRSDALGTGRSEVLIKARHLVNGDNVRWVKGGFVDYFQILFDQHQIIYAEGIAAESMLIDTRTQAALPDELSDDLPPHTATRHGDYEVQESILGADVAARLKAASAG